MRDRPSRRFSAALAAALALAAGAASGGPLMVSGPAHAPAPLAEAADDPVADPASVVLAGQARFTVLTPRLIRMEWSPLKRFEDRASLVFLNRRLPVPVFKTSRRGGWLTLETERLTLRYRQDGGRFTASTLEVSLDVAGRRVTWKPGTSGDGNLLGTTRTLDDVDGATPLETGLVSRDGWVVLDESERLLFDRSEWPWVEQRRAGERQDLYFLGYGHDYKAAVAEFTRLAGRIPMPPRFALGAWWSRYWAFTDQELKQLVTDYDRHDVPLDVLVIDMDWHVSFGGWWGGRKDQAGFTLGWTGFTWDPNYFPDPAGFLAWTDARGLRTPLNLHPASGIQPHEAVYPEMARAMGIDPATRQYVPFDIVDKTYATRFMDLVIHPLERQGVDFWWLDWQQGDATKLKGVNPTWWLNYVFFSDMERQGRARPLIFHRWGGLGNHRYQIGFSGDTHSTWASLAFQPYFTSTAANVGFGYWSHDIGGHMPGPVEPELYTRWVQFGAFSPILRTHTTKEGAAERRIWAYPPEFASAMREAFTLRYALIPYLYTASRRTYDTGVPFLRPMYWDDPESPEAYAFTAQYRFGDDMVVAPVVTPRDRATRLATQTTWLPPGGWHEWFSGARVEGPARVERRYAIDEIPVFVRSGAIIAMQPKMRRTGERPVDPLILAVFPGADATTRIYEDEGNSLGYQRGEFAWTPVSHRRAPDGVRTLGIGPAEGSYPGMPSDRGYEVRLRATLPPGEVRVGGNLVPRLSEEAPDRPSWWFDGQTATTVVRLPRSGVGEAVEVTVRPAPLPTDLPAEAVEAWPGTMAKLNALRDLVNRNFPKALPPDLLVRMAQAGTRATLEPETAAAEIRATLASLPELASIVGTLSLPAEARAEAEALLAASGLEPIRVTRAR